MFRHLFQARMARPQAPDGDEMELAARASL